MFVLNIIYVLKNIYLSSSWQIQDRCLWSPSSPTNAEASYYKDNRDIKVTINFASDLPMEIVFQQRLLSVWLIIWLNLSHVAEINLCGCVRLLRNMVWWTIVTTLHIKYSWRINSSIFYPFWLAALNTRPIIQFCLDHFYRCMHTELLYK